MFTCKLSRVPEVVTYAGAENAVDYRVDCAIQWRHRLDKDAKMVDSLSLRQAIVDIDQVEDEVGTPTQDKHCNERVLTLPNFYFNMCS